MQKVDRLGWAAGWSFQAYGVSFGIRSNDLEALDWIQPYLPPGTEQTDEPQVDYLFSVRTAPTQQKHRNIRGYNLVYRSHIQIYRSLELEKLLAVFENEMDLLVAEHAPDRIFDHSGVVAYRGRALILPGRTHTGKSTLIAALVRAGASYYSDEFAILDEAGLVHPFPRRIQLRNPNGQPPTRLQPEEIGGRVGQEPVPVGMVALCPYRAVKQFRLRAMTHGQAVLGLLNNCVPVRRRPADSMRVLSQALRGAAFWKGSRFEADAAARILLDRMEQHPAAM
ncbi:MAG: hypothetical protein FJX77_00860 [Armatimonadetes bacterium]|nr:hypothetical protein [Armatimonadota bacterium]